MIQPSSRGLMKHHNEYQSICGFDCCFCFHTSEEVIDLLLYLLMHHCFFFFTINAPILFDVRRRLPREVTPC